ncbi:MAG: endonuclease III [Candidatus Micrarchaeota archaeon]|nr:endonuclease III [Candidatus Micrarchaeota archaeon]
MGVILLEGGDAKSAIDALEKEYKSAKYYLNFSTPIDLLVAAIISAQTRDETVNSVTPELFKKFKTAKDYANSNANELVKYIGKVSFAGNKAKNIIATCKAIEEKYGGKVPNKMDELTELPGIGRKTANTILINAYGIVNGIPVDTWVIKLSYRIGLSLNKDPDKIEQDLMRIVDKKHWKNFAYVLKTHGKKICQSQIPICSKCILNKVCPRNGVTKSL